MSHVIQKRVLRFKLPILNWPSFVMKTTCFWAHLCMLHGGLIGVIFCLSVKEIQARIKFIFQKVLSKKMHMKCTNHKVGSLSTSICIFGIFKLSMMLSYQMKAQLIVEQGTLNKWLYRQYWTGPLLLWQRPVFGRRSSVSLMATW